MRGAPVKMKLLFVTESGAPEKMTCMYVLTRRSERTARDNDILTGRILWKALNNKWIVCCRKTSTMGLNTYREWGSVWNLKTQFRHRVEFLQIDLMVHWFSQYFYFLVYFVHRPGEKEYNVKPKKLVSKKTTHWNMKTSLQQERLLKTDLSV